MTIQLLDGGAEQDPYTRTRTAGHWLTEEASAAAFDAAIGDRYWRVYPEVTGTLTQPRPCQERKEMRIDRILTPSAELIRLGWRHGSIGVELKKSGIKLGEPVAQAMDYSRSVWTLKDAGHTRIWLDYVFIWPMPKQGHLAASILAQNRIGSATPMGDGVHFKAGECKIVYVYPNGEIDLPGYTAPGAKAGSR